MTCGLCGKVGVAMSAYNDKRGRLIRGQEASGAYHWCEDTPVGRQRPQEPPRSTAQPQAPARATVAPPAPPPKPHPVKPGPASEV